MEVQLLHDSSLIEGAKGRNNHSELRGRKKADKVVGRTLSWGGTEDASHNTVFATQT